MKSKIRFLLTAAMVAAMSSTMIACGGNSFTDSRDGQKYKTVKIGDKTWMVDKLKFKGDSLFTWESAFTACPDGWRLPTRQDLEFLASDTIVGSTWSSTEKDDLTSVAYSRYYIHVSLDAKADEKPVRCVKGIGSSIKNFKEYNGYKAIRVGDQIWMAKNLDVKTPNSICDLEEESECHKGRYYSYSEAKSICPEGWHLPSKNEAAKLTARLEKLVSEGVEARNDFFELPKYVERCFHRQCTSGYYKDGLFKNLKDYVYWILADEFYIEYREKHIEINKIPSYMKNAKFNVRCIANSENKEQ